MPKSRLKKKSLKSKLTWIVIALAIFLGGSLYAAIQTGTGPLSFLSQTLDINKVVNCDGDDDCIEAYFMARRQGLKGAEADKVVTQVTTQLKNDNKFKFIRNEDGKVIRNPGYDPSQTTSTSNTSSNTSNSTNLTLASSAKPKSCKGAPGVKLTPGKYAATGYGWKDGKRSTEAGTSQRECVYIEDDCGHSTVKACDEVYKIDSTKVILPVSAGPEYYAGKTPAQIRDDTKKNIAPPPKPKENCYDKSGVIMVTGSSLGDDGCFNGEWLSDKTDPTKPDSLSDLDNKIIATCSNTQVYDKEKNECITPVPPTGPTPEEIAAAAAEATKKAEADAAKAKLEAEAEFKRLNTPVSLADCNKIKRDGVCKQVQGSVLYLPVPIGFTGSISYNSGPTAGKPTTVAPTTYKSSSECTQGSYACTGSGSTWVRSGIVNNGKVYEGNEIIYKFGDNTKTLIDNSTPQTPVSFGQDVARPGDMVAEKADCQYGYIQAGNAYVCTDATTTIDNSTPQTPPIQTSQFDRPEGIASYVAPNGKKYNDGACYGNNDVCLSGYCEKRTSLFSFIDRCIDPSNTKSTIEESQSFNILNISNQDFESVKVKNKSDCPNENATQSWQGGYLCYDPQASTFEVINTKTGRRINGENCKQAHQCDELYCNSDGKCATDPGRTSN